MTLGRTVRVFLATEPVDMRGSFDALAGQARRLGLVPEDGALIVFRSRRGQLLKVLHFDGSGWCVYAKRLCRGTFQVPQVASGVQQIPVDSASLASLLAGTAGLEDLEAPRRRWYKPREPIQR